jgi:hypothetical protein
MKRTLIVDKPVVAAEAHLKASILGKIPYAAGKLGSIEASALYAYMGRAKAKSKNLRPAVYPPYIFNALYVNAGVFPQSVDAYDKFGELFLNAIVDCDLLVAWDVAGEAEIVARYCRNATLVKSLEPFFSAQPWTAALQGRRVLVISPFTSSIRKQYALHETLWDNNHVLPTFDLLTLQAPLSAALSPPKDADWFTALNRMQGEMNAVDYDVALIGAGAFSLPLAIHAKRQGKIGIHLGGSLQILFGIYGSRWEKKPAFKPLIKSNWVRPSREETPTEAAKVEDGCYW